MNNGAANTENEDNSLKTIIPKIQWTSREEIFWHSRGMELTKIKSEKNKSFEISIGLIGSQFTFTFEGISSNIKSNIHQGEKFYGGLFGGGSNQKFVISFEMQNNEKFTSEPLNEDELAEMEVEYVNDCSLSFQYHRFINGGKVYQDSFAKTFNEKITQKIPWISVYTFNTISPFEKSQNRGLTEPEKKNYKVWSWPGDHRYTLLHIWMVENVFGNWDEDLIREISMVISKT